MKNVIIDIQGTKYEIPTIQKCKVCGKEFDLLKYGFPGDPFRKTCWECARPIYAPASYNEHITYDDIDALEGRCLRCD